MTAFRSVLWLAMLPLIAGCNAMHTAIHGGMPRHDNYKVFPYRTVHRDSSGTAFRFQVSPRLNEIGQTLQIENTYLNAKTVPLDSFFKLHQTTSIVIIRNDTILYERYAPDLSESTLTTTFSMAKAIVATLVGIAIGEGHIKSLDEPAAAYIPEWRNRKQYGAITIRHLMTHASGLRCSDNYFDPGGDLAVFYWTHRLRRYALKIKVKEPPGLHYEYNNANAQLLGIILENATGMPVSRYLEEKIWKPLGMEYNATWSIDSKKKDGIEKAFCCINARVRDFAKIGRLFLHRGEWNGKRIVPEDFISETLTFDTTSDARRTFHFNWTIGPEKYGSFYAAGLYGQFIYVYPKKNIIIVRTGRRTLLYNPPFWRETFIQIIDQL